MSDDKIGMNHGAGGEVMANLISKTILDNITKKSVNGGVSLDDLDDGATIPLGDYELVVTTDGHTVDPLFFPGGDIGRISAAGTINDVSVMGAKPLAISNAIIMQEGFPIDDLDRIIKSLDETCQEVDVAVVTGDTKVMQQDKLDGIVMVTTGIGIAKKGEILGLEVNMRPPGGYTPDMMNFANDIDVYAIYAQMVMGHVLPYNMSRPYYCAYVGRRNGFNYKNSEAKILARYEGKICMHENMPDIVSAAMGNDMYTARFKTEKEVHSFIEYCTAKKG